MKAVFDYFFATVGFFVSLPILLIIGICIKLTSKGPIFYTQERIGRNGIIFTIIKFRSMTTEHIYYEPVQVDMFGSHTSPLGGLVVMSLALRLSDWNLTRYSLWLQSPQLVNVR